MNCEKNVGVQFQNGANFLIEECAPPELQIPLYMDIRSNVSWTAHHSNWAPCYLTIGRSGQVQHTKAVVKVSLVGSLKVSQLGVTTAS